MERFHHSLSMETVSNRYYAAIPLKTRISPQRLQQVCKEPSDVGIALVAERGRGSQKQIIGVVRLTRVNNWQAELAVVISDAWQGQHLGPAMLREAIMLAYEVGIQTITASARPGNGQMAHIARAVGGLVKCANYEREYSFQFDLQTLQPKEQIFDSLRSCAPGIQKRL
jgi:acetyltransferase